MIAIDNLQDEDPSPRRDLTREDLLGYVGSFPGLPWRIEVARSRIEFLSRRQIPALGGRSGLFMKSAAFRSSLILPEDLRFAEAFLEAVRQGESAEAIVRVPDAAGGVAWLKLAGWTHPADHRYYLGYLMDVSNRANEIKGIIEREADLLLMLELSESPVALFDLRSGKVLAQNEAACQLFLYSAAEFRTLSLPELCHPGTAHLFQDLCARMARVKLWEGRAQFLRQSNAAFAADARVRFLDYHGQQLLRVSWTQVEAAPEPSGPPRADGNGAARVGQGLAARLEGLADIRQILAAFLEAQLPSISYDAILFSDIHAKKNKVFVYSAGEPFTSMPQGAMFSFEGTIAQDIERFKLDTLFVDDTLDSIKAIDWALFIPKGVRSYFAKPFYERGVLRSILILCSLKPGQFPSEGLPEYAALYAPFRQAIQAWRTAQRRRPTPNAG